MNIIAILSILFDVPIGRELGEHYNCSNVGVEETRFRKYIREFLISSEDLSKPLALHIFS